MAVDIHKTPGRTSIEDIPAFAERLKGFQARQDGFDQRLATLDKTLHEGFREVLDRIDQKDEAARREIGEKFTAVYNEIGQAKSTQRWGRGDVIAGLAFMLSVVAAAAVLNANRTDTVVQLSRKDAEIASIRMEERAAGQQSLSEHIRNRNVDRVEAAEVDIGNIRDRLTGIEKRADQINERAAWGRQTTEGRIDRHAQLTAILWRKVFGEDLPQLPAIDRGPQTSSGGEDIR